ncbi:MAG TPA: rhodanese-like domain-containing protein [Burkholderiales bacterium]|nr:rhodanese-like domain-containing protein [Burkholderiales bacterium]
MTEIEPLQPQRRFAAFAFALLAALSLVSTLTWNIDFGGRRPAVRDISAIEARAMLDSGAIAIDVRDKATAASAHLPGALLIPLQVLSANLGSLEAYKTRRIVVYCGDGSTSGPEAAALLGRAGFANVVNLRDGFESWRSAGLPTASDG